MIRSRLNCKSNKLARALAVASGWSSVSSGSASGPQAPCSGLWQASSARSHGFSAPAAQTSCLLKLGDPGSRQPSAVGAEWERRYPTGLDPDSPLALPASAVRTFGKMSVELSSGLVSAPPRLPRVRRCHLPKLADETLSFVASLKYRELLRQGDFGAGRARPCVSHASCRPGCPGAAQRLDGGSAGHWRAWALQPLATTSSGVAWALGKAEGENLTVEEVQGAINASPKFRRGPGWPGRRRGPA